MLSMDKVSKTILTYNRVFQCQKSYFRVCTSFRDIFSMVDLDINEGGTTYMGISPRRTRPCTHRPEEKQERPINVLHPAARDLLGKNVTKEVCFWL